MQPSVSYITVLPSVSDPSKSAVSDPYISTHYAAVSIMQQSAVSDPYNSIYLQSQTHITV